MHVLRGAESTPEADRETTRRLVETVGETGDPAVRVWYPPDQVAFGRRDTREPGYDRARRAAADRGYPAVERETGGRAVAFTGSVLAAVRAEPVDPRRPAVDARYDRFLADLEAALEALGVDASRGEPPNAFCPGSHSLSTGGKVAGLAQRIGNGVATAAAVVVVDGAPELRSVLEPVYAALSIPFDPDSVGSLAAAGCSRAAVARTVEARLVGDAAPTVRDT